MTSARRQAFVIALTLGSTVVLGTALFPATSLAGPAWAQATLDQYFRVEWESPADGGSPVVSGYVTNLGSGPAERMQLAVERLDSNGTVVGTSTIWLPGVVSAGSRTYFTARVTTAAGYRVRILAFDWANCRN